MYVCDHYHWILLLQLRMCFRTYIIRTYVFNDHAQHTSASSIAIFCICMYIRVCVHIQCVRMYVRMCTGEEVFVMLYGGAVDANVRLDRSTVKMENTYITMSSQRYCTYMYILHIKPLYVLRTSVCMYVQLAYRIINIRS